MTPEAVITLVTIGLSAAIGRLWILWAAPVLAATITMLLLAFGDLRNSGDGDELGESVQLVLILGVAGTVLLALGAALGRLARAAWGARRSAQDRC